MIAACSAGQPGKPSRASAKRKSSSSSLKALKTRSTSITFASPSSPRSRARSTPAQSRFTFSPCQLTIAMRRKPERASSPTTSATTAISVSARSEVVPGKPWPPPDSARLREPKTCGGAITRSSRAARRSESSCGIRVSTESGRCGPCCSVAPTDQSATAPRRAAASTSGQVISAISGAPLTFRCSL